MNLESLVSENFIRDLVESGMSHKEIGNYLKALFPAGQRGISPRSVERYCMSHNLHYRNKNISTREINAIVDEAVKEVGPTYGRKFMTGHLRHTRGLKIGINRVGLSLKSVSGSYHKARQLNTARLLNPIPYHAEYFGHKIHLDQNEKLGMYGVTEVVAVDGYSSLITAFSVMPIKNNVIIYEEVYRFSVYQYGMWDQVRVDHGKEFFLTLFMQDFLSDFRTNCNRQPYLQFQSKQNHVVERFWVEANSRVNYPVKAALVELQNSGTIDMGKESVRYCGSWFTLHVVKAGLKYVIGAWNSRPIPGKGVPMERMWQMHRVGTVSPHLVPSAQDALNMYRHSGGQIQIDSCFGQDPLATSSQKASARDNQFNRFFPSFQDIFHDVVNGNAESFRNGLLYYTRLTEMLN